jgi:(p)ppGpp synthase/HD superfamily hydrolase
VSNIPKILDAASFAAEKHTGQKRKGRDREPYINHPLEVADLLATVGKIEDEDILAAGLLHDTVEDCDVTFDELSEKFGQRVAGFVQELTDDKSLPKAERKQKQVELAPRLSPEAKQIKIADKISNIRDVIENPPDGWSDDRRRQYVEWGEKVVAGLRGANTALEDHFDSLVERAKEELK